MIFGINIPDTTGHQMALQVPTSPKWPSLFLHYLGKTEQTKYALKWTTNVKKLETRLHKNLITAVWANEVHLYLLTAVFAAIKLVTGDTLVFQQYSALAREVIELLVCETSDFTSPDLLSATALTSIRSITSSGGSRNSGSIRWCSRMWMNSRSNWLKCGLVCSRT